MDVDWVRRYCMALPHTTETVQWGANLVFKIAGKMYAMAELEAVDHWLSFKCSPEDFAELCERAVGPPPRCLWPPRGGDPKTRNPPPGARSKAPFGETLPFGFPQTSQKTH